MKGRTWGFLRDFHHKSETNMCMCLPWRLLCSGIEEETWVVMVILCASFCDHHYQFIFPYNTQFLGWKDCWVVKRTQTCFSAQCQEAHKHLSLKPWQSLLASVVTALICINPYTGTQIYTEVQLNLKEEQDSTFEKLKILINFNL